LAGWTIIPLLEQLGYDFTIYGPKERQIKDIAPLDKATHHDLSFCSSYHLDDQTIEYISGSNAGVILCNYKILNSFSRLRLNELTREDDAGGGGGGVDKPGKVMVFVDNPRLAFIKIAKIVKPENKNKKDDRKETVAEGKVSKHAVISDSAKIGRDCYIGDFAVIADDCIIGDNTVIESRVTLQNCQIGNNCTVQSGTVLGEDGFAFERETSTLNLEGFPHYGKVIIKDNVDIFANCSIARGSIADTIIHSGSKIDALCHVAHNVCIGKNTELTAGTIIGGSTTIGDNCWLGLNCTIKNKITVGNKVIVGSGSSVIYDVQDEDIVAGIPAKSIRNKVHLNDDMLFLMVGHRK
jgi:UDP-3-O-[3-hydroxymyristoyl] glucosamine N-acyltransferase